MLAFVVPIMGRFVYTPILPLMQADGSLSLVAAGWLAGTNHVGYLVGALTATRLPWSERTILRTGLIGVALSVTAMALPGPMAGWFLWRWTAGVFAAWAMIHTSAWGMRHAVAASHPEWSAWVFSGSGLGLIVSGLVCAALIVAGGGAPLAWAVNGACLIVITMALWSRAGDAGHRSGASAGAPTRTDGDVTRLVLAYGLGGFGYITAATFLPVLARAVLGSGVAYTLFWPLFGVAAWVSLMIASPIGIRIGDARAYRWSLAVMAAGAGSDFLHLSFELMAVLFVFGSSRSADNFHDALHETLRLEQEKDRLVSDLEQARRRAESSDRAKSEFLANISHELRTPMNGIMGMADLLAMGELGPGQQELLQPLRQSADELLQKIENMIELSALEVGELVPRPVPFNLPELVDTLLAKHRAAAAAKGLAFLARHDAGLPPVVVGDADLVGKILHHLVDNAIKFTAAGGVDIATALVATVGDGIEVAFVVRDTGPGIPADRLESLFGLFTQGDGSSTRRHGGTGIGLAIARRLAETLGGSLTVDSRPGGGTTIRIALPFRLPRS